MTVLLLALLFATTPPQWAFIADPASPHWLRVSHNWADLGRCAMCAWDGVTVHFLADEIAKRGFE